MKPLLFLIAVLLSVPAVRADSDTRLRISRDHLGPFIVLPSGIAVTVTGEPASPELEVKSASSVPVTVKLLEIAHPPVTTNYYAIVGQIRYEEVSDGGYLELWNHFGDSAAYFSRTLAQTGAMAKLAGRSGWRSFVLPFNATGTAAPPTSLTMNLHLPARGTVVLSHLELREGKTIEALFARPDQPHAWWPNGTSGWIGGVAGVFLGCLGTLLEWLVKQGKARTFVVITTWALIGLGAAALVACVAALGQHQPSGVWYSLGLVGILCVAIFSIRLTRYRREYREGELRKMASLDAVGA